MNDKFAISQYVTTVGSDVVITNERGSLQSITLNSAAADASIEIHDHATASSNQIGEINCPTGQDSRTVDFKNTRLSAGLVVVLSGVGATATVVYAK